MIEFDPALTISSWSSMLANGANLRRRMNFQRHLVQLALLDIVICQGSTGVRSADQGSVIQSIESGRAAALTAEPSATSSTSTITSGSTSHDSTLYLLRSFDIFAHIFTTKPVAGMSDEQKRWQDVRDQITGNDWKALFEGLVFKGPAINKVCGSDTRNANPRD